jgi:hypothetical protein
MPPQVAQVLLIEYLGYEAHACAHVDALPVASGNARRLLASVLEGIDAIKGEPGHVLTRGVDAEYPALFP